MREIAICKSAIKVDTDNIRAHAGRRLSKPIHYYLQSQGMPQGCINVIHWKRTDDPVNFSFGNGGQIISHDNRIREQTRLLSFECGKLDNNTALVLRAKHPTGYHGHYYLRQSGLKVIGLNNHRRTSFGSPQIGMGKED